MGDTEHKLTPPLAILGGTFDPIHNAHLQCANAVMAELAPSEVRFIPCKNTLHKASASADAEHRLAMLTLALQADSLPNSKQAVRSQAHPGFIIDTRELNRETPSFTLETLESLREEHPHTPLCFILGSDSVEDYTSWHGWEDILGLAHLIVVPRQDTGPTDVSSKTLNTIVDPSAYLEPALMPYLSHVPAKIYENLGGTIYVLDAVIDGISSTDIRSKIVSGENLSGLMPESVINYLETHNCYS